MVSTVFQDLLIHGASPQSDSSVVRKCNLCLIQTPSRSSVNMIVIFTCPALQGSPSFLFMPLSWCPVGSLSSRCPAFWIHLGFFSLYVWGGFLLSPQAPLLGRQEAAQGDWGHVQYPWSMEMNYRGGLSMLTRTRVH